MRFLSVIGSFLVLSLVFSSCQKDSNNNPVPSISFKSFNAVSSDSAYLQINFTDGDGDIGYQPQDASAPPNLWVKYMYYDYTTQKFIGLYNPADSMTNDTVYFTYHVPYITPAGKNKSLTGIIQVALKGWYVSLFNTPDSTIVQYQVWLIDRAGHKSNVITTPQYHGL